MKTVPLFKRHSIPDKRYYGETPGRPRTCKRGWAAAMAEANRKRRRAALWGLGLGAGHFAGIGPPVGRGVRQPQEMGVLHATDTRADRRGGLPLGLPRRRAWDAKNLASLKIEP
jgi:hypothetical protein